MADLRNAQKDPTLKDLEFMFACRDGKKINGWVPDKIYVTDRAMLTMSPDVIAIINKRKSQGSAIISCHDS